MALCDGQPCIMDVTVGSTVWRDVPAVLGDVPYEWGERRVHISVSPAMSVVFFRSVDGEHVGRGRLAVDGARLPVGWVLVWYGEPCGLSYYPRTSSLVVRYPHSLVNIALRGQGFSPHTAIHDIRWQDPAFESDMQPDLCIDNITDGVVNSQWRGFHMRHYTP
jgi:hypothetical protein